MGLKFPAKSDIKTWGFPGDDAEFKCPLCGKECGVVLHTVFQEHRIAGHVVNGSLPEEQQGLWGLQNFLPLFEEGSVGNIKREMKGGWCVGSRQPLDFTIEDLRVAASESTRKLLTELISDLEGVACS